MEKLVIGIVAFVTISVIYVSRPNKCPHYRRHCDSICSVCNRSFPHLRQFFYFPKILGAESIESFKIDSGWLGNQNPILRFPNLRRLHAHADDLRSLLKALGFLPKLRKISVGGMPFDFREFAKYPQLEELDITGGYLSYKEDALREAIIQDAMDTHQKLLTNSVVQRKSQN
jgi:hypothetical protein